MSDIVQKLLELSPHTVMKQRILICIVLVMFASAPGQTSASTNAPATTSATNGPLPITVHLDVPGAVSITNTLTVKPDKDTAQLLQSLEKVAGSPDVTVHLDSASKTQLQQFTSRPFTIRLDDSGTALLKDATADKWFKKDLFISSLLGAAVAIFAGWCAHLIGVQHKRQEDRDFVRNVLKSIEAELEALGEIFNRGIGGQLKESKDGMFLVRLALSQNYFTVFEANALHLGKIDPKTAKSIISVYITMKALIENFRINNDYIQMYDAVTFQWRTTFAVRPDGLLQRGTELEGLLRKQRQLLQQLTQELDRQYTELKTILAKKK
ncbi:MAG: hypothetical protein JWO95_1035 [Verrucomicrobiales bacterium]|nr:hypothetical protein [Verrucomicrobiales bacterium]